MNDYSQIFEKEALKDNSDYLSVYGRFSHGQFAKNLAIENYEAV